MDELLNQFLVEEAIIVIPVLMILGKIIKEIPNIQNWIIPHVLLVLGVLIVNLLLDFSIESTIQGVLVSGAAVLGHQLYTQTKERGED